MHLFLAVGYLVLCGVFLNFLSQSMENSSVLAGFTYKKIGNLTYNLVPLRNYLEASSNGYAGQVWVIWLVQIVAAIPMGIFIPMLSKTKRTYVRTLGWCVAIIAVLSLISFITAAGVIDIDFDLLFLAGTTIGYVIWRNTNLREVSRYTWIDIA